ncbi:MAG: hypothetical protein OHK0013_35450 [Sandaracinaceae bacterium]
MLGAGLAFGCGAAGPAVGAPRAEVPWAEEALDASPRSLVEVATGRPDAVLDLGTEEDARIVSASWRYAPAPIVEAAGFVPGPDLRPVAAAEVSTHDLALRPRREGWDEAAWAPLAPHALEARRGTGHLSMGWYRLALVLPDAIQGVPVRGATVALEVTVDDYGEVWVDGRLAHAVGQRGGSVVAGWNAPNRVVLTADAMPGARFDVAILAVNGPISRSPENFHWIRQAMLDVYAAERAPRAPAVEVARIPRASAFDAIVPEGSVLEALAVGLRGLGPVLWVADEGVLLASDVEGDALYRFDPRTGALSTVQTHVARGAGLTAMGLDSEGRLLAVRGGSGALVRYERNGSIRVLSDADGEGAARLGQARERAFARAELGTTVHALARDRTGHVWIATDEGVLVRDANGALLGALRTPVPVRGLAWGGADEAILYLATEHSLLRLRRP